MTQGNHYCHRDAGNGSSGYHYSNTSVMLPLRCHLALTRCGVCFRNGSYYYSNTNGSTYYNSGSGYAQYTSPGGDVSKSTGK